MIEDDALMVAEFLALALAPIAIICILTPLAVPPYLVGGGMVVTLVLIFILLLTFNRGRER